MRVAARAAPNFRPEGAGVLPAAHRMRRSEDFSLAVRRGRRAGSTHLAVHLLLPPQGTAPLAPARVGVVVSKAVGTAVTRTGVKRRLRAVAAARIGRLPDGALAVVRATPASAAATSEMLAADLDRMLKRVLSPPRARVAGAGS